VSITIPFLIPYPKVQTEQVIWCSSFAHLVCKTCEQGQASGLKKISTFWRSACGSSFSKGSIFFATLAHTAATLHSSAPAHYASSSHMIKVLGINNPRSDPDQITSPVASFGAHRGVAACFAPHRSLNPHPWLHLPP